MSLNSIEFTSAPVGFEVVHRKHRLILRESRRLPPARRDATRKSRARDNLFRVLLTGERDRENDPPQRCAPFPPKRYCAARKHEPKAELSRGWIPSLRPQLSEGESRHGKREQRKAQAGKQALAIQVYRAQAAEATAAPARSRVIRPSGRGTLSGARLCCGIEHNEHRCCGQHSARLPWAAPAVARSGRGRWGKEHLYGYTTNLFIATRTQEGLGACLALKHVFPRQPSNSPCRDALDPGRDCQQRPRVQQRRLCELPAANVRLRSLLRTANNGIWLVGAKH